MCWSFGAAADLPRASDLRADGKTIREAGAPLLVLYSQAGCQWCEQARREYLLPMSQDAHLRGLVSFRQIDMDSDQPLIDFHGKTSTHREFAKAEKIKVTPTLVIYGPMGERLDEAIVGMRLPDFYGQYIAQSIETAREKLAGKGR